MTDALFTSLEDQGWAWGDDLLPPELATALAEECEKLWMEDKFQLAHIGKEQKVLRPDIRGDSILWLEKENPASAKFLQWAHELRALLNERYFLNLNSEEFHFARYPAGAGYHKHFDQLRPDGPRKISIVLYLNRTWSADDGGELVIYSPKDPHKVEEKISPSFGRLVVFRSDLIPHEVLPCFQTRWSLTGWFRKEVQSLS